MLSVSVRGQKQKSYPLPTLSNGNNSLKEGSINLEQSCTPRQPRACFPKTPLLCHREVGVTLNLNFAVSLERKVVLTWDQDMSVQGPRIRDMPPPPGTLGSLVFSHLNEWE